MRFTTLAIVVLASLILVPQAGYSQGKKKAGKDKEAAFKPVEINGVLDDKDVNDPKLNHPSKKFTVKLVKDKTYVIDMISEDFDAYLRLLDKGGAQLAEDDDSGGNQDARIFYTAKETGDHQIVATTFDGGLGKFTLKVAEFNLKGEAKARDIGDGIEIKGQIANTDKSVLNKLGKIYSVNLKAGQTYTIDMASGTIDSYLYLFDSKGNKVAEDDDSGGNQDARIVFRAEADGVYHILATSFENDETGEFSLNIRKKE